MSFKPNADAPGAEKRNRSSPATARSKVRFIVSLPFTRMSRGPGGLATVHTHGATSAFSGQPSLYRVPPMGRRGSYPRSPFLTRRRVPPSAPERDSGDPGGSDRDAGGRAGT